MANFVYTNFKFDTAKGDRDWDTSDFRLLLVMSNTTADTEEDADVGSEITTLDEMDGSGYARIDLAGQSVAEDDTNDRAELSVTTPTFSSVGVGTRQVVGALLVIWVTSTTDMILVAYYDTGGFPFDANGGDITFTPNAEGLLQLA